ncbi:4-hydroxy-3-methylbut-2-enyl diphosphate reductase [Butyricicoccus faecihominis]|uniref:4-hydroxy-3-methylbut-2-enyl diphosphate reductase n=2 Tax=Butyricicoccus TaxID=580596 RepID=A0ABQ1E272_9FIRM|nr:bifunctional 4-hydroxy-3-methylbut-2-enyl diphosphate reductase/30S ribosomal protein S1 [Butyricicoccus faecihominis]GFO89064.1 4-hydroxy-3-methylbut-2-enyl diphosphate reductase [Butyricicoccus faecihominis]GGM81971.1 4-hydroxy-3-methylbut-2-enyl diphosphate reductase [Butyricicoccus faecihominis]
MSVTVAKTAGFCFGVRRAVDLAEQQAKKNGKIYAYGEIIHNMHEIERLEKLGVYTAHALEDIPDGAGVLIRAHGVPRNVYTLLQAKKCEIFDATCPFVRKIHKIADKESADGRLIVILGSAGHPEVVGIQGWCGESVVLEGEEQARAFSERLEMEDKPISLVAQTTVNRSIWNISVGLIKKRCTNLKIFDTICKATDERQSEARLLAGVSDQMIVIGDKKSSNTKRLYEISRSLCSDVRYIEDAAELTTQELGQHQHIGITAGASTPAWIIKEVSNMMSEETKIETGEDFAAMLEESFKTLNNGEKVTGTVVGISNNDVQVDLGVKHTAYIPLGELSDDPNYDVAANIHVGDEIEAVVVRVNDGEGTITLSKKRVDQLKGWETVEKAYEEHTPVEGTIVEENRGGVVATAFGVRVFIPASQTGVPKDQPMSQLVKTKQSFYITEINRQRKRVVGSIRQIQQEARKAAAEQIWNTIEIGNEYDGTVKSLTSYGAFVDIGGVDGMVHISELSWGRIKHPSEVVSVGDKVKVFVIGLDKENKKISLGYKREEDNPWNVFKSKYDIGSVAEVKILKFMPFGAFAEIVPGVDGLIHISQIADHRIAKPEDELEVGQVVEAKIIDINDEKKKVSLSIRALLEDGEDYED